MDEIDLKILQSLQTSGRIKNAELAREVGMAPSSMLERIRRLEEQGLVRGYHATIEPQKIGLNVQAFISVTLDRHEVSAIQKFEQDVQTIPHVRACYHLTGRFDYLLHVAVADLNRLGELVKADIAAIPNVGKSETFLVLSEIKPDNGWPIADLIQERLKCFIDPEKHRINKT